MSDNSSDQLKIRQQEILRKQVEHILSNEDLDGYRGFIKKLAADLGCSSWDCAAAIVHLYQPNLQNETKLIAEKQRAKSQLDLKMVRFRLEIGRQDRVTVEQIKKIMVNEAGVELRLIGYINIRKTHAVISLPEGMPADIFQHLKEVEINQQALNIKRLGGQNRKPRLDKKAQRGRHRNFQSANKNRKPEQGREGDSRISHHDLKQQQKD